MLSRPRLDRLTLLWRFKIHRLALALAALSVLSRLKLRVLEPGTRLGDWFWWRIVTIMTVGYSDVTPSLLEHTEVMTDPVARSRGTDDQPVFACSRGAA